MWSARGAREVPLLPWNSQSLWKGFGQEWKSLGNGGSMQSYLALTAGDGIMQKTTCVEFMNTEIARTRESSLSLRCLG